MAASVGSNANNLQAVVAAAGRRAVAANDGGWQFRTLRPSEVRLITERPAYQESDACTPSGCWVSGRPGSTLRCTATLSCRRPQEGGWMRRASDRAAMATPAAAPLMPPMLAGSGFKLPARGAAHHSLLVGAGSTGRGVPA